MSRIVGLVHVYYCDNIDKHIHPGYEAKLSLIGRRVKCYELIISLLFLIRHLGYTTNKVITYSINEDCRNPSTDLSYIPK